MSNKIEKWYPLENIPKQDLYVYEIEDTPAGLMIILEEVVRGEERPFIKIFFSNCYESRKFDENILLKTWDQVPDLVGRYNLFTATKDTFAGWTFQSFDRKSQKKVLHFIIGTGNDVLEILAPEPPLVSWIPLKTPFYNYLIEKYN